MTFSDIVDQDQIVNYMLSDFVSLMSDKKIFFSKKKKKKLLK